MFPNRFERAEASTRASEAVEGNLMVSAEEAGDRDEDSILAIKLATVLE